MPLYLITGSDEFLNNEEPCTNAAATIVKRRAIDMIMSALPLQQIHVCDDTLIKRSEIIYDRTVCTNTDVSIVRSIHVGRDGTGKPLARYSANEILTNLLLARPETTANIEIVVFVN
ncbi:hypothetical protein CBL_10734 [Carabus blaptoides fortunei]